jgi:hypothetical protein
MGAEPLPEKGVEVLDLPSRSSSCAASRAITGAAAVSVDDTTVCSPAAASARSAMAGMPLAQAPCSRS